MDWSHRSFTVAPPACHRGIVIIILKIHGKNSAELLPVARALNCPCFFPRCTQSRQQHPCQYRNNRNYDQELDQGKIPCFPSEKIIFSLFHQLFPFYLIRHLTPPAFVLSVPDAIPAEALPPFRQVFARYSPTAIRYSGVPFCGGVK